MSIFEKHKANLKADYRLFQGSLRDFSGFNPTPAAVAGSFMRWDETRRGVAARSASSVSGLSLNDESKAAFKAIHGTNIFTLIWRGRIIGTGVARPFGTTTTTTQEGFSFVRNATTGLLNLRRFSSGNNNIITAPTLAIMDGDMREHTIIVRGDGDSCSFWLDGVKEVSASAVVGYNDLDTTSFVQIGRSGVTTDWKENVCDRFSFFNTNLPDADVGALLAEIAKDKKPGERSGRGYISPSKVGGGSGVFSAHNFRLQGDKIKDETGLAALEKFNRCTSEPFLSRSGVRVEGVSSPSWLKKSISNFGGALSSGGIELVFIPKNEFATQYLFSTASETTTTIYFGIRIAGGTRTIQVLQRNLGAATAVTTLGELNMNTVNHVAVNSNGAAWEVFINGQLQTLSGTNPGSWFAETNPRQNIYFSSLKRSTAEFQPFSGVFLSSEFRETPYSVAEVKARYEDWANRPIYLLDLGGSAVGLYPVASGYLAGWRIESGTWRIAEDSTGKHLLCVTSGQIKTPLITANAYTTKTFTTSGTVTLTKNANDLQIDGTAGAKIYNLVITP
jgi:hypothetical protein